MAWPLCRAALASVGYACQGSRPDAFTRLHAVRRVPIADGGAIPWMVAPPDGDGVLGGPHANETSAAVSRLYVRVLRPDQKWCTLRHRAGARIQLRHRGTDADARESCTQCATIGDEPFVTLSSELRMQLADARFLFAYQRRAAATRLGGSES